MDLKQNIAELEQRLQAALAERDELLLKQIATAEILKLIKSSPDNLAPVFNAIAERANRLIGGHSSGVFLFANDAIHLAAFTPVNAQADTALMASYPRPIASIPQFARTSEGHVVQIADVASDEAPALAKQIAQVRGWRSALYVPLNTDRGPIGAINVNRKERGTFLEHDLQLLQTFADQAVIAIENARLFNEAQERTAELTEALEQQTATSEVLEVISNSPGDLQPVFKSMLNNALRICDAKFGQLLLFDGKGFLPAELHNTPAEYAELFERGPLIPAPNTGLGRLAASKEVIHVPDLMAGRLYSEGDPLRIATVDILKARTLLAVPMLKESGLVGAIIIYRQEPRPFGDRQIKLVTNFAAQAVIAIENARLLRELRQRTDDLSKSLDDLRAAQDRLVQTEKLASLGQLTAGIAHEIKNPLNFVNNFSALSVELVDEIMDVFQDPTVDEAKRRKELDEIQGLLKSNLQKVVQHGKRADSIIKNMLLHSREGSSERQSAEINRLVEESLSLAYHGARAEKAGFNITLKHDLDPEAGALDIYPQEMTRALLNLISNGFYAATKRKTEAGDETFEPVVSAITRNLGRTVEIRIRDNGTGISPEVREKIFHPFFTTKPTGEGTGLGLSMTHDIVVKQHGGKIDVETEPGAFTEFIITLPRDSGAVL